MTTLPRIDLHRHLDGNIRLQTILDLADKNHIRLPAHDLESLRPFVTVTTPQAGLLDFLAKFHWPIAVLASLEDCYRVAWENVEDAARENLDYIELRFSPLFMASAHGLPPVGVVEAVTDGIAAGCREFSVRAESIGILSRTYGAELCREELRALLAFGERLVAIDLAGDEANFPARHFVEHFRLVREAGLGVTIHAGEAAGAESIWDAIHLLGATRIGHGVRAIEDPVLLDFLVEKAIGLECCPTSNVQTSTVTAYEAHPLRTILARGILATINTDDPGISAISLDHELTTAASRCGLDEEHVRMAQANSVRIAFRRL